MTKQEHLEILKGRRRRANAFGDRLGANEITLEIEELEKVTDKEYSTYIKVRKLYAEHSTISGIVSKGK